MKMFSFFFVFMKQSMDRRKALMEKDLKMKSKWSITLAQNGRDLVLFKKIYQIG